MAPGISETASFSAPELEPPNDADQINTSLTYGFVFDYCGVEVDRDTGAVRIDKYVTTHDAGRILNPLIAEGQIYGSFGWGVGCALLEEFAYSSDGSFLSGTFADYLCPTSCEVPRPVILHMESPSPFTPLGAKGLAEGNVMSTPVCIANAVADALGVKDVKLPLTLSRVKALMGETERPPRVARPVSPVKAPQAGAKATAGSGTLTVPVAPELVWQALLDPTDFEAHDSRLSQPRSGRRQQLPCRRLARSSASLKVASPRGLISPTLIRRALQLYPADWKGRSGSRSEARACAWRRRAPEPGSTTTTALRSVARQPRSAGACSMGRPRF